MEVDVFPNPTQNFITVVCNGTAQFQLIDMAGKIVESGLMNGKTQLDLSTVNTGLYFLSVVGENGFYVSRVAKQ